MSQAAKYIEPALLNVKDLNYDSWQTIYFQRTTVIVTELVLVYALHLYCIPFFRVSEHTNVNPATLRHPSRKSLLTQLRCLFCYRLAF
jgi:hypothetical protein